MKFFKYHKLIVLMTLSLSLIAQQTPPVSAAQRKEQIPYGLPKTSKTLTVIGRKTYVVGVDKIAKLPAWASYTLTSKQALGCYKRSNSFAPDQSFNKGERAEMIDYAKSGYDIGHMVPCGDQSFDEDSEKESFLLTNMAPQRANLNRGLWKKLETYVRGWSWKRGHTLQVYVGPIYDKSKITIGPNKVVVPHAFFKVVTDMQTKETVAFIFPHRDGLNSLEEVQTTVLEIEKETGIKFPIALEVNKKTKPKIEDIDQGALRDAKRANCKNWLPEDDEE